MSDPIENGPQMQEPENQGLSIQRPYDPTQEPDPGQSAQQGESVNDLPEEYKPYKEVVPWERLPDDVRQDALQGIKKFHGDLTREHQEFSEIKKRVPELEEKGRFLDYLYNQPEFINALKQMQSRGSGGGAQAQQPSPSGGGAQAQQPSGGLDQLSEYGLDPEIGKTLESTINNRVEQAVNPLTNHIQQLEQQLADREVQDQMSNLSNTAQENGLPDPRGKLNQIREVIRAKRANNISDAYFLAIQDELPNIYTERAKKEMQDKMQTKQENTMPPGYTPATTPTNRSFNGPDAIDRALRASEQELGIKF